MLFRSDPHELTNLIDNAAYATQKALLQSYLAQYKQTVDTFWYSLKITYKDTTQNFTHVMTNVTLPTTFKGYPVTWTSMSPTIISNSGVVTKPKSPTNVWVDMRASVTIAGKVKTTSRALEVVSIKPPLAELTPSFTNQTMIQFYNRSKGNSVLRLANDNKNSISIYTILGQLVYQNDFASNEIELNLPQGAYVVSVSNQYGNFNKKVIVTM